MMNGVDCSKVDQVRYQFYKGLELLSEEQMVLNCWLERRIFVLNKGVCATKPVVVAWINMRRDGRMHSINI